MPKKKLTPKKKPVNKKTKKRAAKKRITKKTTFVELMKKYPRAGEILFEKGMHCIGCNFSLQENIEEGALAHGMNPDDLVRELNEKLGGKL